MPSAPSRSAGSASPLSIVPAARAGNLSRAAESLHLTVSALSHQIRGLEERLGQRLFVRVARGVELTADGQCLFDRVSPHFDAIEQALQPYRARRDDVLTITLMPSLATSWLVPRLHLFNERHPDIQVLVAASDQPCSAKRLLPF